MLMVIADDDDGGMENYISARRPSFDGTTRGKFGINVEEDP